VEVVLGAGGDELILLSAMPIAQLGAIALGGIAGILWCRSDALQNFGDVGGP
jgi:chromate transporter